MKRLLWIGDAACGSGFGQASSAILRELRHSFDVHVLAINYDGDPHPDQQLYPIYRAASGGDSFGLRRLTSDDIGRKVNPDLVVVQTNPWNIPLYREKIPAKTPMIGVIAVEGKCVIGTDLNQLSKGIFWTEFGRAEAVAGGMTVPSAVIPLGVDLERFKPGDKRAAREFLQLPDSCLDAFIVGNINRNQHRKRLDLTILYFSEWLKQRPDANAYLYLHAVTGSGTQVRCDELAAYCGLTSRDRKGLGRFIYASPRDVFRGAPEEFVVASHQAMDVHFNTTLGEGWGLTPMEAMACGVPVIAGDYAALGEWARDGAILTDIISEGVMPDVHTLIGGVPDKAQMIDNLDQLYLDAEERVFWGEQGRRVVSQPQYRWENIARRYAEELRGF